jgi:AcrR family transcriptional regulator
MSSSISYDQTGRTAQKARTRDALIAAARRLLADGTTPTVEQAATAASIARATAYRYFPNQRDLLVATVPELTASSMLGPAPPADPAERLHIVAAAIARQTVEHEPALRTMLRISLDPGPKPRNDLPFRIGRRITWVAQALAPLQGRLSKRELDRLVHAIAAAVGIDALVWLTDVAGLSRKRAIATMEWSANALLRAALVELETGEERSSAPTGHLPDV